MDAQVSGMFRQSVIGLVEGLVLLEINCRVTEYVHVFPVEYYTPSPAKRPRCIVWHWKIFPLKAIQEGILT